MIIDDVLKLINSYIDYYNKNLKQCDEKNHPNRSLSIKFRSARMSMELLKKALLEQLESEK